MNTPHRSRPLTSGNISDTERWLSLLAGVGVATAAFSSSRILPRILGGAAGLVLLARGATGHCTVKAALQGETSLGGGVKQQLTRMRERLTPATARIEDMDTLYDVELQELYSAECQLGELLESIAPSLTTPALAIRLDEYLAELRVRRTDLGAVLAAYGLDPQEHADTAMSALLSEARKVHSLCSPALKEAALTASVQRIIHYKIAGYGTIAAYAKALGRVDEAGRFAALASRDKAIDAELSLIAKHELNPEGVGELGASSVITEPPASTRH